MKKLFFSLVIMSLLSACTWVKLTPGGEKVRVLSSNEVSSCKKLGKTLVTLKTKIAGVKRNADKVKREMETMARNSAVSMDGDTVVPVSDIMDGQQVFAVYRCIKSE